MFPCWEANCRHVKHLPVASERASHHHRAWMCVSSSDEPIVVSWYHVLLLETAGKKWHGPRSHWRIPGKGLIGK